MRAAYRAVPPQGSLGGGRPVRLQGRGAALRTAKQEAWVEAHVIKPEWLVLARTVMHEVQTGRPVMDALRRHPLEDGGYLGKYVLVAAYHAMVKSGELQADARLLEMLRMKPVRTLSGVTTVTV